MAMTWMTRMMPPFTRRQASADGTVTQKPEDFKRRNRRHSMSPARR
jgi:hypothetical protein